MTQLYVEGSALLAPLTGIGRYTYELLTHAIAQDPSLHVTVFALSHPFAKRRPELLLPEGPQVTHHISMHMPMRVMSQLNKWAAPPPLDVILGLTRGLFFFPNFVAYPLHRARSLVTIHDTAFLDRPGDVERSTRRYYQRVVKKSVARADRILAVSDATKASISAHFGVPSARIDVVGNAAARLFQPGVPGDICRKYDLPPQFTLAVGTLEPRKNLVNLMHAYAALPPDARADCPLVLAGGHGWNAEAFWRAKQTLDIDVRVLGYVPDADLRDLYRACTLFTMPSFMEGFGIPALEAMACGAPVIASATPALQEVCGPAARYVDPHSPAHISLVLLELLRSPHARAELSAFGRERAAAYSWSRCATAFLGALDRASSPETR